jgi:preprotein translocase subunit SecD
VPGACVVGTLLGGVNPEYLYLVAAKLTAADVKRAGSFSFPGSDYVVNFTLKRGGLRKLNTMARSQFGLSAPQDTVAIVVDGVVESNPAFQSPSVTGPIQITGNFTPTQAAKLARALNRAAG